MPPVGVNLSHRNWLPGDALSISCFGSNQGHYLLSYILAFFLKKLFFQTRKYRNSMKISGPSFDPYYFSYPDESIFRAPFIWPPALGKGMDPDSLNSKVVNVHRKEESAVLSPWRVGFSLSNPVQYFSNYIYIFCKILKSKELQNRL